MTATIKMFVQTNSGVASKPGASQRNIRLIPLPAPDAAGNPNGALFAGGTGGFVLDGQNLTPELAAALQEGTTVDVVLKIPAEAS